MKTKVFVLTAKQVYHLDQLAALHYKIPTILLMENAGRSVSDRVAMILHRLKKRRVVVVCGKGNNGGDGFVAARHLLNRQFSVSIWLIGNPKELKNDARLNFEIVKRMKIPVHIFRSQRSHALFQKSIQQTDVIVDALFGIGLTRILEGPYVTAIEAINRSRKTIISIDLPSGLQSDTGHVMGACVNAAETVTLAAFKIGLLINDGPRCAGRIRVADISIPNELIKKVHSKRGQVFIK